MSFWLKSSSATQHMTEVIKNLLREKAATTNWIRIYDQDINIHVKNITEHSIDISKACIPCRLTRIRPDEPPWMTTSIKHYIRLRKRANRKAKRTHITGLNSEHL